jgi:hypothetical protein
MEDKGVLKAKLDNSVLPDIVSFRKTRMYSYVSFCSPMVEQT